MRTPTPDGPPPVPDARVRAAHIPRLAILILMPSRAEREVARIMRTAEFQDALEDGRALTRHAFSNDWSLKGWAEWWAPPRLLGTN
jgi:hypothetical protein